MSDLFDMMRDWRQDSDIQDAKDAALLAQKVSLGDAARVSRIEFELQKSKLIIQILSDLLVDKGVITESELNDRIKKTHETPAPTRNPDDKIACSHCGQLQSAVFKKCISCGNALPLAVG